jgi:hypothetical protein
LKQWPGEHFVTAVSEAKLTQEGKVAEFLPISYEDYAQGPKPEDIRHTIDHSSHVLHIPQVIIRWPSGSADHLHNLLTETYHYLGVLSEHVYDECKRGCRLTVGNEGYSSDD